MTELTYNEQARGTRVIVGFQANQRRELLNKLIQLAQSAGYNEITLPTIELAEVYKNKAGEEILNQMYVFPDKKDRQLCLRPEGTATIQLLANEHFKNAKNVKLWYFERCYRYEKPQAGRYREFYQFGIEVLNPTSPDIKDELIALAEKMVEQVTKEYETTESVKRGLAYYVEDGFEIGIPTLGAQKQVVGGGRYKEGIGFAIGFDRLALLLDKA